MSFTADVLLSLPGAGRGPLGGLPIQLLMSSGGGGSRTARWLAILKAILYELQPISTLPTRQDFIQAIAEARATATALCGLVLDAYRALAPHVLPALRRVGWKDAASFAAWLLVYYLFVRMEFGTVYMIVSAMLAITTIGLGDTRRAGDMSAWSVFNAGFHSLLGTLQAEQFENEIMHRLDNIGGGRQGGGHEQLHEDEGEEEEDDDRPGVEGQDEVEGHQGSSRKSGKKARRRFDRDERRRKREAAAQRQVGEGGGLADDGWDSDG